VQQSNKLKSVLVADLEAVSPQNHKHRVDEILESLSDVEREAVNKTILNMVEKNKDTSTRCRNGYSYKWLADVLTKNGHAVSANQIRHYVGRIYKKRNLK
jgi:ribosomal protein L23